MTTKKYRMARGRYARWEGTVVKHYKTGDPIELTDKEAASIVSLIEPVAAIKAATEPVGKAHEIAPHFRTRG